MYKPRPDRPVTLPLMRLRLPVAGWVSLMHRVSGVLLLFSLPFGLFALQQSLRGPDEFACIQEKMMHPAGRLVILLVVWALAQHLFAGIRHLLMDLHWGVGLSSARLSGLWVMGCTALVVLFAAWRLFS